jgi:hypothetical protein
MGVVMVVVKDPLRSPGGGGDGRRSHALVICQVWRLDLGSSSPRRTHDVKIGYIPSLMVILSVKASQVLVVPKNVGFSIPRYEPEPKP